MTGGIALILGAIGRNFAAGMSGGIAYIFKDPELYDSRNFNMESIEIEKTEKQDLDIIKDLIEKHYANTFSNIAKQIITNWELSKKMFVKIMPTEYKLALEKLAKENINQIIN
jgi:glutamate synthase (NADPH/NADH) large chain